ISLAGGLIPHFDYSELTEHKALAYSVDPSIVSHLIRAYGCYYEEVLRISHESSELKERLVPSLPNTEAELVYALRHEMAAGLDDLLERRTRIALVAGRDLEPRRGRIVELITRAQASPEFR